MKLGKDGLRSLGFVLWSLISISAIAETQDYSLTNLWELDLGSVVDSAPAVAEDGTIYCGTFQGKLFAVNPDGTRKWVFRAGREIYSSPAVGDDGTVYFGSRDRKLYAVTAQGKLKWAFATGLWVDSSPGLGADGAVYFGSWDEHFYALGPDGSKRWTFPTGGPVTSSPAIALDGRILFGSQDGKLYALAPDGRPAWVFTTGGAILSSPAVGPDGAVFFTSLDGFLYALNADGSLRWRLHTGSTTESSPSLAEDGAIYLGVNNEIFTITSKGKREASVVQDGEIRTTPMALTGRSCCYSTSWGYLVYRAANMTPIKWSAIYGDALHTSEGISPQGIVYAPAKYTKLDAFPAIAPLAKSSWPKFRADSRNTGRARPVTE